MLELIFQGFVEWCYGLTLECWEYFSSALLDLMSMDFAYLKTHVPVIDEIMQIMLAVGWALLIGNLVFQAVKSMVTGLGFEGEDPKLLFTRTFVFAFLLLASPQICNIGLNMTQTVIDILQIPDAVNITFANEATFGGLAAAWILVVICGVIVMFKVFKLIIEIAERYIILAILTICAPLAFGMGGSRNTSDIFTGWCRMFGSMCLVMVTNVIFFKMLLSVLSFVPSGLDVLPWMVLVFGIVKVAKKIDAIITRIGLNPAITGDGLGGRSLPGMLTYAVIRTMAQNVAKTAGKSAGGGAKGASPKTPPGGGTGGPRTGPVSGGPRPGTAGRSGQTPGASQETSQQNNTQQNSSASSTTTQTGGTTQAGAQQTTTQQHNAGAAFAGGVNNQTQNSSTQQNNSTRRSSVPPGTRRAASHVAGQASPGTAGTPPASGANRPNATTGMRSGTAGTGAGQTTRFTNSSTQSVNEGGADSRVNASERNGVNVGTVVQGRAGAPEQAARPASSTPPPQNGAQSGAASTRFTNRDAASPRPAAPAQGANAKPQAPAQTTPPVSGAAPAPPNGTARTGERAQPSDSARHGRNDTSPGSQAAYTERRLSPAWQERPPVGAQTPARGAASSPRPGMAGTATKSDKAAQTRQTARNQATGAKSTPTATGQSGGKKAASSATARQEQARTDARRSARKKDGGAKDGK